MIKISKNLLDNLILASRNTFPNEFICLLAEKNNVLCEFVILPSTYGNDFSNIRLDLVPMDSSIKGSFHSHPQGSCFPSKQDLKVFAGLGEVNLILGNNLTINDFRAFDAKGKEIDFEVVE